MTNAFGDDPEGATPLDDEQMDGLRPSWVATRADLNVAEEQNIAAATEWALLRKWTPAQLLTESALLGLHRRMFAEVWTWAGTWRRADTNIGADWHFIRVQLRQLVDDTGVWVEYGSYPYDEIAVRFHHKLVAIHPFPNGDGRHARLAADILAVSLNQPPFSWGADTLVSNNTARTDYLAALRLADAQYSYGDLLKFARS